MISYDNPQHFLPQHNNPKRKGPGLRTPLLPTMPSANAPIPPAYGPVTHSTRCPHSYTSDDTHYEKQLYPSILLHAVLCPHFRFPDNARRGNFSMTLTVVAQRTDATPPPKKKTLRFGAARQVFRHRFWREKMKTPPTKCTRSASIKGGRWPSTRPTFLRQAGVDEESTPSCGGKIQGVATTPSE